MFPSIINYSLQSRAVKILEKQKERIPEDEKLFLPKLPQPPINIPPPTLHYEDPIIRLRPNLKVIGPPAFDHAKSKNKLNLPGGGNNGGGPAAPGGSGNPFSSSRWGRHDTSGSVTSLLHTNLRTSKDRVVQHMHSQGHRGGAAVKDDDKVFLTSVELHVTEERMPAVRFDLRSLKDILNYPASGPILVTSMWTNLDPDMECMLDPDTTWELLGPLYRKGIGVGVGTSAALDEISTSPDYVSFQHNLGHQKSTFHQRCTTEIKRVVDDRSKFSALKRNVVKTILKSEEPIPWHAALASIQKGTASRLMEVFYVQRRELMRNWLTRFRRSLPNSRSTGLNKIVSFLEEVYSSNTTVLMNSQLLRTLVLKVLSIEDVLLDDVVGALVILFDFTRDPPEKFVELLKLKLKPLTTDYGQLVEMAITKYSLSSPPSPQELSPQPLVPRPPQAQLIVTSIRGKPRRMSQLPEITQSMS